MPHLSASSLMLILGIAPAVGLGICRFAYSLVFPDMRESLEWSYSTSAGLMNTMNLAVYLAGHQPSRRGMNTEPELSR